MATSIVSQMGEDAPSSVAPTTLPRDDLQQTVINVLNGYIQEGEDSRKGGENPRDEAWRTNIDRYWSRTNFVGKAEWQAKETLPEFSSFVDRFAAALKEALVATPDSWYTVVDPADPDNDLTAPIKSMTDVWLSTCAANPQGQPMSFETVFEDQAKMGALMACCAAVIWRDDTAFGRVAVESVDPRNVWLDATGRGLYRIRRLAIDAHKLRGLAKQRKGRNGGPVYNVSEIERWGHQALHEAMQEHAALTGSSTEQTSSRRPIELHEVLSDIIAPDGKVLAEKALTVLADKRYVIRGPEKNPFWHERDWIIYAPLVGVPLSVYGRSYAEDFGSVADVFTKLTNLLLDAVTVSSMKIFAIVPEMLVDPSQAATGVWPGKMFKIDPSLGGPADFMHAVDMGTLGADTVRVWQMLKSEMTEAAGVNEIGLGQFAPHSRTSATEVSETQQSSSALVRSVAQSIEQRFLEPVLDAVWKTGLQHMKRGDLALRAAAGEEMFEALFANRKQLVKRPVTFQARGISTLIEKSSKLRMFIQLLQVIGANEVLTQQFFQVASPEKVVDLIFDLANIDMRRLALTDREKLVQQMKQQAAQQQAALAQSTQQAPPGAQQVAQQLGVAR